MNAEDKILKARLRLVAAHPFFSYLLLRLELRLDESCDTGWTDGRVIAYCPNWIDGLTPAEMEGFLAHEVMHLALLHHLRRGEREMLRWNLAGDFVINGVLSDAGFDLPVGGAYFPRCEGESTEEVYRLLPDFPEVREFGIPREQVAENEPYDDQIQRLRRGLGLDPGVMRRIIKDRHSLINKANQRSRRGLDLGGCGGVRDLPGDEKDNIPGAIPYKTAMEWQLTILQAMAEAKAQGNLPLGIERLLLEAAGHRVPWKSILAEYLMELVKSDYSWKAPNARYLSSGVYLPILTNKKSGQVVVVLDTSGSVGDEDMADLAGEIHGIASSHEVEVELLYADCAVAGHLTFSPGDLPADLHPRGGGGTDYRPAFKWIEKNKLEPVCAVYLTDGWCDRFPKCEPEYPVLWVVGGKSPNREFKAPWGQIVRME